MRLGKHFILLKKKQKDVFMNYYKIKDGIQNVYLSKLGSYDYLNLYEQRNNSMKKERYVLFFGKILSYKGLKYLLPAMELVHKTHTSCKLIVAGSGEFDFDVTLCEERSEPKWE